MFSAPNPKDFIIIDKELIKGLSQKEIELEHLKTVIVGLNEKLKVREDIEQDVVQARQTLVVSEQSRTTLHFQLEESGRKTVEEAEKNKKFQEIIINENNQRSQKVNEQLQTIQERERDIENLRHVVNQKDRETNELRQKLLDLEEVNK